mgnify:CR=1 FL=1
MLIVLFVFEIPSTPNIFGMLGVTVVTASRYNLLILHKSLEVTDDVVNCIVNVGEVHVW